MFSLICAWRLSKQWRGWWFETSSCPLWCYCNVISLWFHPLYHTVTFFTCHDSTNVSCVKYCSDWFIRMMRAKVNVHRIWIAMEKSSVKWDQQCQFQSFANALWGVLRPDTFVIFILLHFIPQMAPPERHTSVCLLGKRKPPSKCPGHYEMVAVFLFSHWLGPCCT